MVTADAALTRQWPRARGHGPLAATTASAGELLNAVSWADGTPLEALDLATRTYNSLRRAGRHTLGQLRATTDDDLWAITNFGAGQMRDLRAAAVAARDVEGPLPAPNPFAPARTYKPHQRPAGRGRRFAMNLPHAAPPASGEPLTAERLA